jgi:Holliday junction resolvasome RuvABC endonuclease subunit
VIVLGLDPSLCNLGIAAVEILPVGERVIEALVIRTEPSPKKRRLLVGEDDARRVAELVGGFRAAVARHQPAALVIEAPAGSQHAKSARALGLAFGAMIGAAKMLDLPLAQVTVQEVKRAACGRKDGSKDDVIAAMEARYPGIVWPSPAGVVEHAADAIAAVVAALDGDTLRMARQIARAAGAAA